MYNLDPQVKLIWSLGSIGRVLLLSAGLFIIEITSGGILGLSTGFASGGFFILGLIYSLAIPQLRYKFWKFDVRDEELYVERGVLTRVKTLAPFVRMQHLDVEQNLFERMAGLAKLVVYTAGSRGADITIPGLPVEYAEDLRDKLRNYAVEDAV